MRWYCENGHPAGEEGDVNGDKPETCGQCDAEVILTCSHAEMLEAMTKPLVVAPLAYSYSWHVPKKDRK